MNPYFNVENEKQIESIEELVSLNIPKKYDANIPGTKYIPNLNIDPVNFNFPYESSGIFRGQISNWPLIPKCFREVDLLDEPEEEKEIVLKFRYRRKTREFWEFCERAEKQNADFPKKIFDRMSIAQHFGVPTPLLDWSQNVFTAIFFAIREVFSNSIFEETYNVYLYHIQDERHLSEEIPKKEDLALSDKSVQVKPFPIDRRIERQKGVFTYHPYPKLGLSKIPINVYKIDWNIIENLIDLMKGFGFTEDYYFPDYAGIANAVNSETTL